jgi:mono/diheme cytochrome c family protein
MKRGIIFLAAFAFTNLLLAQSASSDADKASIARGKTAYEQYCLACHQADGSGVPHLNPPLIKTKWTMGDKKVLINVVLKGLDDQIEVDGETYQNVMPPMAHLSDQEIADVLTFIRNSFGNKASTIKESDVKALRETAK